MAQGLGPAQASKCPQYACTTKTVQTWTLDSGLDCMRTGIWTQ